MINMPNLDNSAANNPKSVTSSTPNHFNWSRIGRRFALLLIITITGLYLLSMTSSRPTNLGADNGLLAKCPESPNCVSTQATDEEHGMPSIPFAGSSLEMIEKIKKSIGRDYPRANLVSESDHYLHFEFKSLIFRFIDDVEFVVDDKQSVLHFRSASRVGHSDMGVNRKRMKQISERLKQ